MNAKTRATTKDNEFADPVGTSVVGGGVGVGAPSKIGPVPYPMLQVAYLEPSGLWRVIERPEIVNVDATSVLAANAVVARFLESLYP